jgi:hypothetical protein
MVFPQLFSFNPEGLSGLRQNRHEDHAERRVDFSCLTRFALRHCPRAREQKPPLVQAWKTPLPETPTGPVVAFETP